MMTLLWIPLVLPLAQFFLPLAQMTTFQWLQSVQTVVMALVGLAVWMLMKSFHAGSTWHEFTKANEMLTALDLKVDGIPGQCSKLSRDEVDRYHSYSVLPILKEIEALKGRVATLELHRRG